MPSVAPEPSESYIASAKVGAEDRSYAGAARVASGGADERRARIELGISGAYLRSKGAQFPTSPVTLDDGEVRQHPDFFEAAVEEVLNFGLLRLWPSATGGTTQRMRTCPSRSSFATLRTFW